MAKLRYRKPFDGQPWLVIWRGTQPVRHWLRHTCHRYAVNTQHGWQWKYDRFHPDAHTMWVTPATEALWDWPTCPLNKWRRYWRMYE